MKPDRGSPLEPADDVRLRTVLEEGLSALGLFLEAADVEAFVVHYREMMRWRSRADLTALADPREIAVRHYLDSLTLAAHIPQGATIADLGTGAGFPGIPVAIARPDVDVTVLETREVKLAFLHHVATRLRRSNLHVARTSELLERREAEKVRWVVARAVADVEATLDRCARLLSDEGQVWLMRGPSRAGERGESAHPSFTRVGEIHLELPIELVPRRIVMYQHRAAQTRSRRVAGFT